MEMNKTKRIRRRGWRINSLRLPQWAKLRMADELVEQVGMMIKIANNVGACNVSSSCVVRNGKWRATLKVTRLQEPATWRTTQW